MGLKKHWNCVLDYVRAKRILSNLPEWSITLIRTSLPTYIPTYLVIELLHPNHFYSNHFTYFLLSFWTCFFPKLKKGFFAESWVWVCTLTSGQTRRRRLLLRSPPPSRSTSSGARSSFPPFDISLWLFCNVETLCDFLQQHFRLIRLFLLIHIQSFVLDGSWYLA